MARLPSKENLSGPASLVSGRAISSADTSAIGRGIQSFGGAVIQAGAEVEAVEQKYRQRQATVDLARANAYQDQQNLSLLNEFDRDPDYATFGDRAPKKTKEIADTAAGFIRDPEVRELWQLQAGTTAARTADAVVDKGFLLQQQADIVAFDEALETQRRIYIDPNTPDDQKEKARASIEGAIGVGLGSGLLTPDSAKKRTDFYLDGADFERAQLDTSIAGGVDAAAVVRQFEGFRTTPYWDVNAHRIGYGSDTITRADGTVVRVKPGMVISREDAERDLERRIGDFQGGIVEQIGAKRWEALPAPAQSALTSVAYNYGSLPDTVVAAIKSGDQEQIAQAVEALQDQNGGVNQGRRLKEAALIRGQGEPAYFANLPADQRQTVYDMRAAEQAREATAAAAQAKVEYETHRSAVELGILTGEVVSETQILSDPTIADDDKATLLRSFRTEQDATAEARALLTAIGDGSASLNPYDSDDRSAAGKAYDLMVKSVPPEQQVAASSAFIQETGIVPAPVVADVRRSLSSTQSADVAAGLQQAAALYDTAPQGLDAVEHGKELREAAATYDELVNGRGLSIEAAAAHVITMRDPDQKQRQEVLETTWKAAVKDKVFQVNDVLSAFDGGFLVGQPAAGVTPAQEAALTSDYLSAAERAFMGPANGDPGIAKQIAVEEMRRTYGISETSGQRALMKFPPENFYPAIEDSHGYIRDLALKDAKSLEPTASNVMLVSTDETAQDIRSGAAPRYNMFYRREDGVWDMAPDMFLLDPNELKQLTALESEKRRIEFEEARARKVVEEAKGLPPLSATTLPVYLLDMVTSDEIPGNAERKKRLEEIETERNGVLGRPNGDTGAEFNDEFMRQVQQYQAGTALGAFNAPLGGQ